MMATKTVQKALKMPLKRGSKPAKKKPSPKDFSRQSSEHEVHLLAWQWVQKTHSDLLIFHVPNGGNRNLQEAIKFKRMGVLPGVADFLMFVRGSDVAIEMKDGNGKQSEAQVAFQKRWEALGKVYLIARSLKEFQKIVNGYVWPWTI
jgi:hypothetical protein